MLTVTPPLVDANDNRYREIGGSGSEQEFFDVAKQSDKMVCHFYRRATERCAVRMLVP